jgi:ectoine hydroxylase-related dioxygenase (phytanoyl-CoA dioxygenase family)
MTVKMPPLRTRLDDAKRDLDEVGLTRFMGAADEAVLDAARKRLDEQAAGEDAHGCAFRDTGKVVANVPGAPNQRVWNLINKGEIFRRMVMNANVHALIGHLLGEDFLLFSFTANIANRGGEAQALHGDQKFAPPETPYPLIANCVWMLDAFTDENGATRVVPASHKAGRWPDPDDEVETAPAEGPDGAIMVWDGRLWHGTGVNRTDRPRRGLLAAYCKPFLRTQENSTISVDPKVLEQCSPELLTLLGYRSWTYGLGSVEGSARGVLNPRTTHFTRELEPR